LTVDPLDRADLDSWLAWQLLRQGRLSRATLEELVGDGPGARPGDGASLARALATSGLVARETLEELLRAGAALPTLAPPTELPPKGRRIGDYELLDELGSGGAGVVYRARHSKTGAVHALKVLSAGEGPQLARFQNEGEGQARLDGHPHVVRVHALGVERGRCYLAMDLAEGGSLAQRLREGPAAPEVAAGWIRDLARAVEHAHQRGVLHRDLKPENVLFDGQGVPKLADFGLVKLQGAAALTATGAVLGTPAYLAPEQVDASLGETGPATDVYGLGATLYHCLTGRPPFIGGSVMAILWQGLEKAPPPIRKQTPGVSPALEAVCLKALAKTPKGRFSSAGALADALDLALADPEPTAQAWAPRVVPVLLLAAGCLGALWWAGSAGEGAARPDPGPEQLVEQEQEPEPPESTTDAPPVLPDRTGLPWASEPHRLDMKLIDSLAAESRWADVIHRLQSILSAPRTQSTASWLRHLALVYAVGPVDPVRSREFMARAALAGDGEAAGLLANHYLAPRRRREAMSYASWDAMGLEPDLRLAAAGFQLTLAWCLKNRPVYAFAIATHEWVLAWPTTEEAYQRVWSAFPEAHPPLPTVPTPEGPLEMWAAGPSGRVTEGWLVEATSLRSTDPERAQQLLVRVVTSAPSSLHAQAYRQLAYLKRDTPHAVSLLARAALIGDQRAAAILAAAFDADHAAQVDEQDQSWDLDLAPDPELGRACRTLAIERDRAARASAYQQLWTRIPEAR
jgi:Protein kinase domain